MEFLINAFRMMILIIKEIDIIKTISKELQLEIMKFFMITSISRILNEQKNLYRK